MKIKHRLRVNFLTAVLRLENSDNPYNLIGIHLVVLELDLIKTDAALIPVDFTYSVAAGSISSGFGSKNSKTISQLEIFGGNEIRSWKSKLLQTFPWKSYNNRFNQVFNKNVATSKCNLGKVNLKAMLVCSFPSYTRGDLMPLAGAPRGLYTVACLQFFAKCYCNSLLFACQFDIWYKVLLSNQWYTSDKHFCH